MTCPTCQAKRAAGLHMTPLGWQTFHDNNHGPAPGLVLIEAPPRPTAPHQRPRKDHP